MKIIRIAAALILRGNGDTLLVRKRGATVFMQPGGKIEPNETPVSALVRELQEEIGLAAEPEQLAFLGSFEARAAHEPDHLVTAEVFRLYTEGEGIEPGAEIEEVRWVAVREPGTLAMASLTEHEILPAWRRMQAVAERAIGA